MLIQKNIRKVFRYLCRGYIFPATFFLFMFYVTPALANQEAVSSRSGSVLNILFLGCIAYFLVRSFRRRSGGGDKPRPGKPNRAFENEEEKSRDEQPVAGKTMDRHEAARQAWTVLSSGRSEPTPAQPSHAQADEFDEVEFLEGAKLFFSRFQQANDSHKLSDIKDFISDEVYSEVLAEVNGNSVQVHTEIISLNARLVEMKTEEMHTYVSVFYEALLRKGISGEQPVNTRAVWEFVRNDEVVNALWILKKISKIDQ